MQKSLKYSIIALIIVGGGILFYNKVYMPKTTYETVKAKVGDMYTEVFGIGNLGAKNIYLINAQTGGKILNIFTDEGEWVKKGDLLLTVDPVDLLELLEEAKISVNKASLELAALKEELNSLKAQKTLALITYKRYDKLKKQAFVSQAEYDKTKADLDVIEAQIKSTFAKIDSAALEITRAGKNVQALEVKLSRYKVYAPIDGYVISKEAEEAQTVTQTQPILKIVDPETVWIKAYIDDKLSGDVKVGQKATITLRSQRHRTYEGVVKRIVAQSDAITLEKEVDVAFEKLPIPFYINEQAEVNILTSKLNNVLKVPVRAIAYYNSESGVWTDKDGKAHFKTVKVLARGVKEVAISQMDKDTEVLIGSDNKRSLAEGMRIH